MNHETVKAHENELLGHVLRMAALEQEELRRMANEVNSVEELVDTSGKGNNFFKAPELHTTRRKKPGDRRIDSYMEDEDKKKE